MHMIRKEFIRKTGMATASLAALPLLAREKVVTPVRVGLIGVGLRGQDHLSLLLRRSDVEVVAIADIDQRMLRSATDLFIKNHKKQPKIYTGDDYAWKKLLEKEKLDTKLFPLLMLSR